MWQSSVEFKAELPVTPTRNQDETVTQANGLRALLAALARPAAPPANWIGFVIE